MKNLTSRMVLKTLHNYVVFFLLVGFAVTCCMMLFVKTLAHTMGIVFTEENITAAALITFLNVLLLTFLFGTIDYLRRKRPGHWCAFCGGRAIGAWVCWCCVWGL